MKRQTTILQMTALLALSLPAVGARAETYANDGLGATGEAGFQAGFIIGEGAAACFQPPASAFPIRLEKIQLMYGGSEEGASFGATFEVYSAGGNGSPPSNPVFSSEDFEITSSQSALTEVDLVAFGAPTLQGPSFCVAIKFQYNGLPSVARDNDGSISAGNNWIYAIDPVGGIQLGWMQSSVLGLTGDWIIRAVGTPSSGPGPDTTEDTSADVPDVTPDTADTPDATETTDTAESLYLEGIQPASGCTGEDIELTILGGGFSDELRFRIGPAILSGIDFNDTGEARGTLEASAGLAAGTYDLIATERGVEVATSTQAFQLRDCVLPSPEITSITPNNTDLGDSANIVILGDNFADPMTVSIGGRMLPSATVTNAQTLSAFVPGDLLDEPGTYDVIVGNADGGMATLREGFEFNAKAKVSDSGCSATPTSGNPGVMLLALGLLLKRRSRQ